MAKSLLNNKIKSKFNIYSVNSSKLIKSINVKNNKSQIKFDSVFLLVKPNVFNQEGDNFIKYIDKNTKVISCMAGVKVVTISRKLKTNNVVRIMPNILSLFESSHTCIFSDDKKLANWTKINITNLFGTSFILNKENDIHKATALFGSGPAFIAKIINSYINASKKMNLKYSDSNEPILNLFKDVLEHSKKYENLDNFIKKITSKKGTTQEGINYLEDANIEKIMYNTFNKAYKRSKELSLEK